MGLKETVPAPATVLVVEDHADSAEMLSLILETEGYRVQTVATASAALDVLSGATASQIGVMLLDLTLPDMNGDELIRRLKLARRRIPPVLIMSAKPAGSLDEAARTIGAAGIIKKPFDIQVLLEIIRTQLNRHPLP